MNDAYFSNLLPQLSKRAARATINLLGYSNQPLRRHLAEVFSQPYGTSGNFIGDPAFEAVFGWQAGTETMRALSGNLLTPELVAAMDAPPDELTKDYRFPKDRCPYRHQVEAWRILARKEPQSLIVTSGTGSGKTECFMVPILDQLTREQQQVGGSLIGVRALFLYPLNALINSQRDRLRAWTEQSGKNLRFCLYNGNTPDEVKASEAVKRPSEVMDRRTLRSTPPPILVTNATMLEYLLVRAQDAPILQHSRGKLQWVVLDEAHSYIGSQAAEVALLLRRVLHGFGVTPEQVRFVATSATIGDPKGEAGQKLKRFLASVAGVDEDRVHVVAGLREVPQLATLSPDAKTSAPETLWALDDGQQSTTPARYAALASDPMAYRLRHLFVADADLPPVARLSQVCAELFPDSNITASQQAYALSWLDLLSSATEQSGQAFLPLRGHVFHQTLPGLWACADSSCPLKTSTQLANADWPFGTVYFSLRQQCSCGAPCYQIVNCDDCGSVYLEAETTGDGCLRQRDDKHTVDEFELDVEQEEGESEITESVVEERWSRVRSLIVNRPLAHSEIRHIDRTTRKWTEANTLNRLALTIQEDKGDGLQCPHCEGREMQKKRLFRAARIGAPFLLGGILPTLLEYSPDGDDPANTPFRGRRLLTFSDSRQGTARLAARLQQESERNRVRGLAYHHAIAYGRSKRSSEHADLERDIASYRTILATPLSKDAAANLNRLLAERLQKLEALSKPKSITYNELRQRLADAGQDFQHMLATYRDYSSDCFGGDVGPIQLAGMLLVREFGRRPKRQNNLESMGMVAVQYPALEQMQAIPAAWRERGATLQDWRDFLKITLDFFVRGGGSLDMPIQWRNWLGIPMPRNQLVRAESEEVGRGQRRWPSVKYGKHNSTLVRLLKIAMDWNPEDRIGADRIDECLRTAWSELIRVGLLHPTDVGHVLRLESMAFAPVDQAWVCPFTRRFLDVALKGMTPYLPRTATADSSRCDRVLIPIYPQPFGGDAEPMAKLAQARAWLDGEAALPPLRDEGLWSVINDRVVELAPYFSAAEHSAQQPAKALERYEKDFKEGRLNLLSCSTTMEMGIDIGGVRLVAMNNVPPHPANYLQRAGRAGRRQERRSCAVTLCKPNPHDQAVFANARWPFDVRLPAPVVSLSSAVIVQRHVNATVLGVFLLIQARPTQTELHKLICGWFFGDKPGSPIEQFTHFCADFEPQKQPELAKGLHWLLRHSVFDGQDLRGVIHSASEAMQSISQRWRNEWRALKQDPSSIIRTPTEPAAKAIAHQLKRLESEYLLRELATQGFLPAHGFPSAIAAFDNLTIDSLKRLPVPGTSKGEDNRLRGRDLASRDLVTALREYAPGADVVMDGRVYRSAGITLNWHVPASEREAREAQAIKFAWRCKSCGASGGSYSLTGAAECQECGTATAGDVREFLEPSGFSVDFEKNPHNDINTPQFVPVEAPWVNASGEWSALPNPSLGRFRSNTRGHIYNYSSGLNGTGYAICLSCGRSEPMNTDGTDPAVFTKPHRRLRGGKGLERVCAGSENAWAIKKGLHLGHEAYTDVLEIQLRDRNGHWLNDLVIAQTLAVALRNRLAAKLGVQATELHCTTKPVRIEAKALAQSILIFDRHAAGYASSAEPLIEDILRDARKQLLCPKDCDSACPHCVLDFDQRFDEARLNRHTALAWLTEDWLNELRLPDSLRFFG